MSDLQRDFVIKTVENRDVHFVRFWFTDVLGTMKSFAVISSELEDAFDRGMGFDGSCIEGFGRAGETDMLAFPSPTTFQILPWRPDSNAVGRMFCNICTPAGEPFEGDPRYVLKRICRKAADMGYVANVGPELEYFYFKSPDAAEPLDRGGLFDLTSLDSATDLRRDTIITLEKMGIPVEYSHHERGFSQHEIDLRFTDALSMADAVMTYKQVVKEIALKHGVYASFMPKPMADQPGSSMHMHQSLFDLNGNNAFFDESDPSGNNLSSVAKSYTAGVLKYAPEFCMVTNQNINSYKRLLANGEDPITLTWSKYNPTSLVRVPGYRPDSEMDSRIELRNPDPAANPYLAFSVTIAAGLKGIEEGLELQDPIEKGQKLPADRRELAKMGIGTLPATLGEAIDLFEASELMKEVLGEHIHSYLIEHKRAEWEEYQGRISQWEMDRYLAVL
ncbi:MAG: glutamine synthetase family protein [Eggerthellales bacterium]|nr:glutamine synthetase family protein [Eggerthellales bacterium]